MALTGADLGEGPEGQRTPPPPFFLENFSKDLKENAEMNVQMPFSGPHFSELGSRPSLSNFSGSAYVKVGKNNRTGI